MSENIPIDIQFQIIKWLPIKSLLQFRSVSKPWKSLIDSSDFIADYNFHHSQKQLLLVSYRSVRYELKTVLIDDDDTFPQRRCSVTFPKFLKLFGCSHGLLFLQGNEFNPSRIDSVVLWNPLIQKSVVIKVPNELQLPYKTIIGFGVCPNTNDPKLVKISYNLIFHEWQSESTRCIPVQVEVFTLSSRAWRILSGNLPRNSIRFECDHIVIDGFIYWMAFDRTSSDGSKGYKLIISFDLTSEEFREIHLPDYLAQSKETLSISKLRNSLVVIGRSVIGKRIVYGLWMMEHGLPNSFTKLFIVDEPNDRLISLLGFRENGEPIFENIDKISAAPVIYEPSSKLIKDLGVIDGMPHSFFLSSYIGTLMLLDLPNSMQVI